MGGEKYTIISTSLKVEQLLEIKSKEYNNVCVGGREKKLKMKKGREKWLLEFVNPYCIG